MDPATINLLVTLGVGIVAGILGKMAHTNITATPAAKPATSPTPTAAPTATVSTTVATNGAVAARFPAIHALFHGAQAAVVSGAANGFPLLTQIENQLMAGMAGSTGTTTTNEPSAASVAALLTQLATAVNQGQQTAPPAASTPASASVSGS